MKLMDKCLVMLFFVVCSVSAMNEDKSCYLNILPAEVLDCIASFLMETEEEFVERTKKLVNYDISNYEFAYSLKDALKESCPDKMSSIIIQTVRSPNGFYHWLMINKEDVRYEADLKDKNVNYQSVMLSRGGNRIGLYRLEKDTESMGRQNFYKHFLEIQKINLQKNEEDKGRIVLGEKYQLPPTSVPLRMDFNKQGTLLIVHQEDMHLYYDMFDLKTFQKISSRDKKVQDPNKLQTYLRDKFVCSKYIKGASK